MNRSLSAVFFGTGVLVLLLVSVFSSLASASHVPVGRSCGYDGACGGIVASCGTDGQTPYTHWGACEGDVCVLKHYTPPAPYNHCSGGITSSCRIVGNGGEDTGGDVGSGVPLGARVARCLPKDCTFTEDNPDYKCSPQSMCMDATQLKKEFPGVEIPDVKYAVTFGCERWGYGELFYCNIVQVEGCKGDTCRAIGETQQATCNPSVNGVGYVPAKGQTPLQGLNSTGSLSKPSGSEAPSQVSWLVAVALFFALVFAGWSVSKGK